MRCAEARVYLLCWSWCYVIRQLWRLFIICMKTTECFLLLIIQGHCATVCMRLSEVLSVLLALIGVVPAATFGVLGE